MDNRQDIERINAKLVVLRTVLKVLKERIHERIEKLAPSPIQIELPSAFQTAPSNKDVFIVHGHNGGVKEAVARMLTSLGLNPIILGEQASESKTVIEKFEKHAGSVNFAVVLLTGDDKGKAKDAPTEETRLRARQNVILELGYFMGKLKRERVCALYEPGVELPSDIHGVVYVELDKAESWKFKLGKELKAAKYEVDLNKLA